MKATSKRRARSEAELLDHATNNLLKALKRDMLKKDGQIDREKLRRQGYSDPLLARLASPPRALVTIFKDSPTTRKSALLSEASLGKDWNRPEEDDAWANLQPGRSCWRLAGAAPQTSLKNPKNPSPT